MALSEACQVFLNDGGGERILFGLIAFSIFMSGHWLNLVLVNKADSSSVLLSGEGSRLNISVTEEHFLQGKFSS